MQRIAFVSSSLAVSFLLFAGAASAQGVPATAPPTARVEAVPAKAATAPSAEVPPPPEAASAAPPLGAESGPASPHQAAPAPTNAEISEAIVTARRKALEDFDAGAVDEAYAGLRSAISQCLEAGDELCDSAARGILFRDLGIVLAQGRSAHDAAVQAFRKAIAARPRVTLPAEYQTPKTLRAFDEAREAATKKRPVAAETEPTAPKEVRLTKAFLLLDGTLRLGAIGGSACGPDYCVSGSNFAAQLGVSAALVGTPGRGGLALGGRVGAGGYFGEGRNGSIGFVDFSLLLGSMIGPRVPGKMGYFLVGPVLQVLPSGGSPLYGGTLLGGFVSSAKFTLGLGAQFLTGSQLSGSIWTAMFGAQLGYTGFL